jgi:hypothetical protein
MTAGIATLNASEVARIRAAVAGFKDFDEGNDPYGEHDFGAIRVAANRILWKIDYYDNSLAAHSPDPANEIVTRRVLTIMLAEEY